MHAVRFVIREFDLNSYASTDLNQFYPSDFDFKNDYSIIWTKLRKHLVSYMYK